MIFHNWCLKTYRRKKLPCFYIPKAQIAIQSYRINKFHNFSISQRNLTKKTSTLKPQGQKDIINHGTSKPQMCMLHSLSSIRKQRINRRNYLEKQIAVLAHFIFFPWFLDYKNTQKLQLRSTNLPHPCWGHHLKRSNF